MVLILEITGREATQLGSACRKVFGVDGGLIGRDPRNTWTLPHTKVSGRHARISYQNGVFYIEDTSTNGVFINSSKSRLGKGRPYALKAGDSIFIEPYTISVAIGSSASDGAEEPRQRFSPPPRRSPDPRSDPFNLDDPFGEQAVPFGEHIVPSAEGAHDEPLAGQEVDPLKLLGKDAPPRQSAGKVPSAQDLELGSPIHGYYKPPPVVTPTPPAGWISEPATPDDPFAIPADYDPLAPDTSYRVLRSDSAPAPPRTPNAMLGSPPARPIPPSPPPRAEREPAAVHQDTDESEAPSSAKVTPPPAPAPTPPPPVRKTPISASPARADAPPLPDATAPAAEGMNIDLRSVLEGAGLDPEDVTPDLARNFGAILRIVVAGVMEVLHARSNVKDEFRMRTTQFRPVDNNPLKFSANVDDALHNLLVKRNAAYLKPIEAFDDAFDDLRHHQLAMLAGMRTAFETMLSEFEPDRLQEQFDRQVKRGSLLNVAAKLRYWDLYRDMHEELMKDSEATFRRLFGDAFAKAYEEQLKRLKAQSDRTAPNPPQDPA